MAVQCGSSVEVDMSKPEHLSVQSRRVSSQILSNSSGVRPGIEMLSKSSVPRQGRVAGIIFGDHFALAIPTSFFIISFDQLWSEDQFEAELNLPRRRRRGRNQPRRPADRSPG